MIEIGPDHELAAITWLTSMSSSDKWNLSPVESADLLGLQLKSYQDILQRVSKEEVVDLSNNTLERLSLLLGIWKCLQLIAPTDRIDLAYSGFYRPINNEMFNDRSIKEFLLDQNEIESFYIVRRYLEAVAS